MFVLKSRDAEVSMFTMKDDYDNNGDYDFNSAVINIISRIFYIEYSEEIFYFFAGKIIS